MSRDNRVPEHLRSRLREIVRLLATEGQLDLTQTGVSLTSPEMDLFAAVRDYGSTATGAVLVPLPADAWEHPCVEAIRCNDGSWAVDIALWTTDESPSDLTLQLSVLEKGQEVSIVVDDIHVL